MRKDKVLTEEQQKTWDVLNTPSFGSEHSEYYNEINKVLRRYIGSVNDKLTRDIIVNEVVTAFDTFKHSGKIYDYRAVCDETNNLPSQVDNNEICVDVYLKPTRSLNMINLKAVLK